VAAKRREIMLHFLLKTVDHVTQVALEARARLAVEQAFERNTRVPGAEVAVRRAS